MRPIVILIRDGWGYRRSSKHNCIRQGNTKNTDLFMRKFPHSLLNASGKAVGLPDGYQGNSEVGHLTIGSGRILLEPLVKINRSIRDGSFQNNKAFLDAIRNCRKNNTSMHLIGLLQTEGVHAHVRHLNALVRLCTKYNVKSVIHVITDGRDAPPKQAEQKLSSLHGRIATISGRYYAMDRDHRWNRTKLAFESIVNGNSPVIVPLRELYKKGETDEFIKPRKAQWYHGFKKKDSVIFFNFRTDRTRQLTQAIVEPRFSGFKRKRPDVCFVAMTQYYRPMNALVAFEEKKPAMILGEILSINKLRQLRISETEKYAHVTFFFNGEEEMPFPGEDRILIHSPKVATYDLKPEMSAYEITERAIRVMHRYNVVVMNLVNGDMVGHTGVIRACLKAVKTVDECVGKIVQKVLELDGTALVFADHGNVEDQRPEWRTSHTTNPVQFMLVSNRKYKLRNGGLKDIAPTVLELLNIKTPREMTGRSLIG